MGLRRFLLVVAAAVLVLLALLVWFLPSSEDFRTDNPFWNGTSHASANYRLLPLKSLAALPASPRGSALILVPYEDFTSDELRELGNFVGGGGTLVLADDYGYGNRVLQHLGLKARFSHEALLDPLVNYRNKWFPRIYHLNPCPLTDNVTDLVLNHASSITNEDSGAVLALSSRFSFLDLNGNGVLDKGEPTGPLAVVSQHSLGSGRVILVADPSLFINSMEVMDSNGRFIQNIGAGAASVYIDQSHLPRSGLRATREVLVEVRTSLAAPLGTFGLVVLALAIALRPIWHKPSINSKGDR